MRYEIIIDRQARKEIKALDKHTIKRIDDRLEELAANPYDSRISDPIRKGTGERKARVGDWRIIFEVDDTEQTITILAVTHRRRAYPKPGMKRHLSLIIGIIAFGIGAILTYWLRHG